MAYQPVFVTITDVNGTRQSYSCRRKVTWVDTCIKFSSGARIEVNSSYGDEMSGDVPSISIQRDNRGGPVSLDISGLLGTDTELYLGDAKVNMRELARDPQTALARLVAQYLEQCAQARVS